MKFNVDFLNTFLILFSLVLAFFLPFELFLFSYAVLGPLHYATEISWIQNKSYFLKEKYWLGLCISLALVVAIPALLRIDTIKSLLSTGVFSIVEQVQSFSNIGIFLVFIAAILVLQIPNRTYQLIAFLIVGVFSFFLVEVSIFNLIVGILLPTLIHVYLFTVLFMWYGSLKQNSTIGGINVVLMLIVPILIFVFPEQEGWFLLSEYVKTTYIESNFYLLNVYVSKLIGASDGTTFSFEALSTSKIQLFISFAYTYHYLNWFSKTTVIGWHKNLNTSKSVLIILVWLVSILLYGYDFKLGLILLLFLSFMHVFLEFPINIISMKGIVNYYFGKLKE